MRYQEQARGPEPPLWELTDGGDLVHTIRENGHPPMYVLYNPGMGSLERTRGYGDPDALRYPGDWSGDGRFGDAYLWQPETDIRGRNTGNVLTFNITTGELYRLFPDRRLERFDEASMQFVPFHESRRSFVRKALTYTGVGAAAIGIGYWGVDRALNRLFPGPETWQNNEYVGIEFAASPTPPANGSVSTEAPVAPGGQPYPDAPTTVAQPTAALSTQTSVPFEQPRDEAPVVTDTVVPPSATPTSADEVQPTATATAVPTAENTQTATASAVPTAETPPTATAQPSDPGEGNPDTYLPIVGGTDDAPTPMPPPAEVPVPGDYAQVEQWQGIGLYTKGDVYVQMIDLTQASVRFIHGRMSDPVGTGAFGGPVRKFGRMSLTTMWQVAGNYGTPACVTEGTNFDATIEGDTPLIYPLKVDGQRLTDGSSNPKSNYPGKRRLLVFTKDGFAKIVEESVEALDDPDNVNILGLNTPDANRRATAATGRGIIGLRDPNPDGTFRTVIIYTEQYAKQKNGAEKLQAEWGIAPENTVMLDGGGSLVLKCGGTTYFDEGRLLPNGVASYPGR